MTLLTEMIPKTTKQRGFKALPITKGFNFSPVAAEIKIKRPQRDSMSPLNYTEVRLLSR